MKIKILELFSGRESFSNVARERGHETFTIDFKKEFNPDLCKDIFNVTIKDIPFKPDVIWASPPCTEYSHAKRKGIRDLDSANKIVLRTLSLINILKPRIWIIENPQTGLLKNQPFMKWIPFEDVSYCKYGMLYRKQTRLWNNIDLKLKRCHRDCDALTDDKKRHVESVGNNRTRWTKKIYPSAKSKYGVPRELCLEIIKICEKAVELIEDYGTE